MAPLELMNSSMVSKTGMWGTFKTLLDCKLNFTKKLSFISEDIGANFYCYCWISHLRLLDYAEYDIW